MSRHMTVLPGGGSLARARYAFSLFAFQCFEGRGASGSQGVNVRRDDYVSPIFSVEAGVAPSVAQRSLDVRREHVVRVCACACVGYCAPGSLLWKGTVAYVRPARHP